MAVVVAAVAVVGAGGVAARRLLMAAPAVERATLWTGKVERGTLVRRVRAPGVLEPDRVRWVTSVAAARVDRLVIEPGAEVEPETVLVELANPDLELEALQAASSASEASANLTRLEAELTSGRLAQQAAIARIETELRDARRRATSSDELAAEGIVSAIELARTKDVEAGLAEQRSVENERLAQLARATRAQLMAERSRVERLREIAAFRRDQVDALAVRAGVGGILQDVAIEEGQWVEPGTVLARVARPDRLEAVLRVPEAQVRDVQIGQPVEIDTRGAKVEGRVRHLDPAVVAGAVRVEVELLGPLPRGARPALSVIGTITVDEIADVLHAPRPAAAQPDAADTVFVVQDDELRARPVTFGRASIDDIEIRTGLREGDEIVLSDLSRFEAAERIELR